MSNQDNLNFDGAEWVRENYFVKTQKDIDFLVAFDGEDYKEAANVIRYDGPFNIKDVYQKWDIPVFYIPNNEDKSMLRNEYSKLMKEGMSRREAMTTVCHRHPEKMQLLQEDIGLQKIVDNVLAKKQFGNAVKSEIESPLTSIEITARKQESDQRKQKFATIKAHILNPESGTEIKKDKFNTFIKNYIEQTRTNS